MMDTEQLEKEMQIWNRFMYMSLGAAIAMVASSPNDFSFVGIVWLLLQIAVTPPGFFLLFGKRWKALPLTRERINTIFGYLVASWLLLLIPGILGADPLYFIFVIGYLIFLVVLYFRIQKRPSDSDEMFP
jgi:asparagine N-glycosylation enzyme membrane subunit Stt3